MLRTFQHTHIYTYKQTWFYISVQCISNLCYVLYVYVYICLWFLTYIWVFFFLNIHLNKLQHVYAAAVNGCHCVLHNNKYTSCVCICMCICVVVWIIIYRQNCNESTDVGHFSDRQRNMEKCPLSWTEIYLFTIFFIYLKFSMNQLTWKKNT